MTNVMKNIKLKGWVATDPSGDSYLYTCTKPFRDEKWWTGSNSMEIEIEDEEVKKITRMEPKEAEIVINLKEE